MERFEYCNPNPKKKSVGDCVIRALSIALDKPWGETYMEICAQGFKMADMPTANRVWGRYLRDKGFERKTAESEVTVGEFCEEHEEGTFILYYSFSKSLNYSRKSDIIKVVDKNV